MPKMHAEFEQTGLQPRCSIHEDLGVGDVVFLRELSQEQFRQDESSGRKEPEMQV